MSLNTFRSGLGRFTSGPVGKATVFLIGGLLVFSFVYSGLGNNLGAGRGAAAGATGQGSETVATVNGDPITRAEYSQTVDRYQQQAQAFGQSISVLRGASLHATALDELITAKLQLQAAKKLGLTVSGAEIAKARLDAIRQSGVAEKLGLKPTASITEIDNVLAQNGQGSMEERLPDDAVRQNLLLEKYQTYQANHVVVTAEDARNSFQQYHTRHILIDNKKRSDALAQSQAQQILAKAKAPGADFAALARQFTDDTASKASGGDDGFIDQSTQYVPEFKQAAFALKPGGLTLVKSPKYGYFVIKLEAVRSNLPKDFDKNQAKYIAQVKQQKQEQAEQDLVNGLKNDPNNKIVVSDAELRADREMDAATKESDPAKQQTGFRAALADYQKALAAKPTLTEAGEINAQMALAYQSLHQMPQAIAALQSSVAAADDPDLRMVLGNLLLQNKQTKEAADQFQAASKQAWDNQALHQQLVTTYGQMKRPDLVAQEQAWLKQYQDRQKQMQVTAPVPGGLPPGAVPVPAPAPAKPPQAVQVVPSPAPGAAKVVPAQGTPAPPTKKPAQ